MVCTNKQNSHLSENECHNMYCHCKITVPKDLQECNIRPNCKSLSTNIKIIVFQSSPTEQMKEKQTVQRNEGHMITILFTTEQESTTATFASQREI